ncbi:MAG: DUF998 domain-containing protein [Candidatus Bathyarchaeum sp.]|nr:MAG: DUF998 domain-containing protein [Candidatus Bathyarchaeum sp.]
MNERKYALLGLLGPVTAIFFVLISIIFSPRFSWWSNALSDLGHSDNSEVAPLFNFGLLLSGFFMIIYSITIFRNHAKYTSYLLAIIGLSLQLVATFDEIYNPLHFQVSVLFFVTLGFASVIYAMEKRSVVAFAALIIGFGSWILYGIGIYSAGIAVPEAISSVATFAWIMLSALRIYFNKSTT